MRPELIFGFLSLGLRQGALHYRSPRIVAAPVEHAVDIERPAHGHIVAHDLSRRRARPILTHDKIRHPHCGRLAQFARYDNAGRVDSGSDGIDRSVQLGDILADILVTHPLLVETVEVGVEGEHHFL